MLDASITVAWCFEDEETPQSEKALELLAAGARALVPPLWAVEVVNALWSAERRKRLSAAQSTHFLERLHGFDIAIDTPRISRAFESVFACARKWNLTAYDAAYLELALREGLPLATLDEPLKKAAHASGVRLL